MPHGLGMGIRPRVFAPNTVTPTSLAARFRDTIAATGANVTQWTDLTGGGHHVINGAASPTLSTVNGRPTVNFARGGQSMTGQTMANYIGTGAHYVYAVVNVRTVDTNASTAYDNEAVWADNAQNAGGHLKNATSSSTNATTISYVWDGAEKDAETGIVLNAWTLLTWRHTAAGVSVRVGSAGPWRAATPAGAGGSFGSLRVGADGPGAHGADCQMQELVFYNADIGATDDASNAAYFASRYGV